MAAFFRAFFLCFLLLSPILANALGVGADLYYWNPSHQDVVVGSAVNLNPTNNHVLEYDDDYGIRLFVQDSFWRLSLLHYSATADLSVGAAGGNYYSTIDHPSTAYGPYNSVAGDGEIDLNKFDAEYLININTSSPGFIQAFFGISYAQYENSIKVRYDTNNQLVNRTAENSLLGLRVGIDASTHAKLTKFTFKGRFALGLLAGTSEILQTESIGNLQRHLEWDSTVPMIEADLGIQFKVGKMKMLLGYSLLRFEDVATTQHFVDSTSLGSQLEQGRDAGFSGLKLGIQYEL